MDRRKFCTALAGIFAGAIGRGLDVPLLAAPRRRTRARHSSRSPSRLERVGISSWSFRNYFSTTQGSGYRGGPETIALLDFPALMAERFRVHRLEFVAPHFGSTEPAYLQELKSRLTRVYSRLMNICVDIEELRAEGGLSDPTLAIRERAVEAAKSWIDIAAKLRAPSVRCDPGRLNLHDLSPTIASYRELAAYGRSKGVRVLIENHGNLGSEHPEDLVYLLKEVNNPNLGALPDFGNFPDEQIRERGLTLLFPYASTICHAKGLKFNAQGAEVQYDFRACLAIAKRADFRGVYSIEYEGPDDPFWGVQRVVDELERSI